MHRRVRRTSHVRHVRLAALCALALSGSALVGGCSDGTTAELLKADAETSAAPGGESGDGSAEDGVEGLPSYAVEPPGPLEGSLLTADLLITGSETLPDELVEEVTGIKGVAAALPISLASSSIDGRTLNVAAVDPAQFRRFTPVQSAQADFVWERLAGGEVAVDTSVSKKLISKDDMMSLGNQEDAPEVHVGAYAPLVERIDAVVNDRRGEQLGIPEDNALLVSTGQLTPSALEKQLKKVLGDQATMQTLALEFDLGATQTAVLTGTSVTDAVGTFSYTNGPDGTIKPDAGWVKEYIRTEQVPILGEVTCNKGMLPQLRGALGDVVKAGLSHEINPDEYAGCYYPRYIGRDPSNGLSLHSWGIAVDLNVPGNLRGTVGEMNRQVVQIFKNWGFAWGGDWNYTDPMHFEMSRVVRAR